MHWCLGIRGSGSTWVFNAVRNVALALAPDRSILGSYIVSHAELPPLGDPALDDNQRLMIVKSHETDEAAAAELSEHAQAVWVSIRDPRDCVASLVQYHGLAFDAALRDVEQDARFCARFAAHPRACVLRYEAGFIDDPATLDLIATGFGGVLAASDRAHIFAVSRRPEIEAFIEQLDQLPTAVRPSPGNLVDTVTQWHNHHANRTGEVGRWRHTLSQPQAAMVELRLGDWMNAFGYQAELVLG
jgi:hypothetical protein